MPRIRDVFGILLAALTLQAVIPPSPLQATPGTLDPTFAAGAGFMRIPLGNVSEQVQALAVQADGKTILLGTSPDGSDRVFSLIRHNTNGSLDATFGTGGIVITRIPHWNLSAHALAIQTDGKIVAVGDMQTVSSSQRVLVARYTTTGALDTGFGEGGFVSFYNPDFTTGNGVALQSDGRIVVAGATGTGADLQFAAFRFTTAGAPDGTFGNQGIAVTNLGPDRDVAHAVAVLDDGTLILTGETYNPAIGFDRIGLVKYDTAGHLDTSFSSDGIQVTTITGQHDVGVAVAIQQGTPDKIVVAATSAAGFPSQASWSAARYSLNGSLDASFDGDGRLSFGPLGRHGVPAGLAIQYDVDGTPRLLLAGYTSFTNGAELTIVRRLVNGATDNTFDGDGVRTVSGTFSYCSAAALTVTPTRIIAGGAASPGSLTPDSFLEARFDLVGAPDAGFDGDGLRLDAVGHADLEHPALTVQSDGKILLAERGDDTHSPFTLLRRLADGTPDATFGSNGTATTTLLHPTEAVAMVVQPDGGIVVAGRCLVARYLSNGTPDPTFGTFGSAILQNGLCFEVTCLGLEPDGKLLVAGYSGDFMRVIRLKTDGTLDTSFGFGGSITIQDWQSSAALAIAVRPDGGFVLGGYGGPYSGAQDFAVVQFNSSGFPTSLTDTPVGSGSSRIAGLALQPDGKVVAAGSSTYGFGTNFTLARYGTTGVLDSTFNQTGVVVRDMNLGTDEASAVVRQSDGSYLLAGTLTIVYLDQFGSFLPNQQFVVAAFHPDGTPDSNYGSGGALIADLGNITDDVPTGIALDPFQRAVVAGSSSGYLGVLRLTSGTTTGVPSIEPFTGMLQLAPPFPNPSRGGAVVPFMLGAPGAVRAGMFDAAGRLVRELIDRQYEPGRYAVRWDGRDAAGAPVPGGIYFVRISAGAETRAERVAIVR